MRLVGKELICPPTSCIRPAHMLPTSLHWTCAEHITWHSDERDTSEPQARMLTHNSHANLSTVSLEEEGTRLLLRASS